MKEIRVYSLHPWVNNIFDFIKHYKFECLTDRFEFVWAPESPEYLFVSEHYYSSPKVFSEFKKYWLPGRMKKCIYIGFFEEAIKPDFNLFDYGLSFDKDAKLDDRWHRILPTQKFFKNFIVSDIKRPVSKEEAYDVLNSKKVFCNFLYSHADKERDDIFIALNKYKKVDALGKRFHNTDFIPTGFSGHYRETTLLKLPYKFSIAGENGLYNGYTTEKILTSLQANTIPIYWGNPNVGDDFNRNAFINANDYETLDDLVEFVKYVDRNDEVWMEMVREPIYEPDQIENMNVRIKQYYDFFANIFSQNLVAAKRLERTMHMDNYQSWFMNVHHGISLKTKITNQISRWLNRE